MLRKSKIHKPDFIMIAIVGAILLFGLAMLSSASTAMAFQRFQDSYHFLKRQILAGVLPGLALFFLALNFDYRKLKKYSLPVFAAVLVLLGAVFLPVIGMSLGGSRRWLNLGFVSFQPAELMKIAFIIYLAAIFEKRQDDIKNFYAGFLPYVFLLGIVAVPIVLQPDVGTLSIIAITSAVMFFVAGGRLSHLGVLFLSGLAMLGALIKVAPYRMARFTVFLSPETDPQGIGYHINQALLAIGSGGLFGLGLGNSRQKFLYLPEVSGDSIFAIIAEELGFFLTIGLVALFVAFAIRGLKVAKNAPDAFGRLLAAGITCWLVFQAFVNIGAMLGLLPLTGLPLPFVSYGSSALLVSLLSIGILANISKHTRG